MKEREQLVYEMVCLALESDDPIGALSAAVYVIEIIEKISMKNKAQAVPAPKKIAPKKVASKKVAPKKGSSKPPRKSKPWTQEEKELMMNLRASGLSVTQISKKIQRTKAATQVAISKLEKQQPI